jgi:hypothetical protein
MGVGVHGREGGVIMNDITPEKELQPHEYEYKDNITCPYCGWVDRDSWEVGFGGIEGELEIECGRCEKTFKCCRSVTVKYTSAKPEQLARAREE